MSRAAIMNRIGSVLLSVIVMVAIVTAFSQDAYAATAKPGKVKIKTINVDENTVTLTWGKTKKAKKYKVYRVTGKRWKYLKKVKKSQIKKYKNTSRYKLRKSGGKYKVYKKVLKYKKLASTKGLSYTYAGEYSTKYTFAVRAFNRKKGGKYSATKTVTTKEKSAEEKPSEETPTVAKPGKVQNLKTEITTKNGEYVIVVTWDAVPDATEYEVYRQVGEDVNGTSNYSLRQTSSKCRYSTKATAGRTYKFKVIPKNSVGSGDYSETSCTVPAEEEPSTIPEPGEIKNLKVELSENDEGDQYKFKMTVSWDAVENAELYDVVVTKNYDNDNKTFEYEIKPCIFEFGTNTYSAQFTFSVTPKNSKYTGKTDTVSCITPKEPEKVYEVEEISTNLYSYGKEDPGSCDHLESKIKYETTYMTSFSSGKSLVENNYYVIEPKLYTNYGLDRGVNCPVSWNVKENSIGAETEIRGSNLVIKTPKYTSREQLRGNLIIELSSGEVKAKDLVFAPAFPEFIMAYEDLLKQDMTPDLRRALTLMDLDDDLKVNSEIEELVLSITKNCTTDREKVGAIIDWFHGNIEYVMNGETGNQDIVRTWYYKNGICGGMAKLLAQMIRYADIPAGECDLTDLNHACTFFWLEGEWYSTDGTEYDKSASLTNFSGIKYMIPITEGKSCEYGGWNIKKGYFTSTGSLYHVTQFQNGKWVNNWDLIYG